MPTPEKYVFDTSVLIAFSNLHKIDLLCELYPTITIPDAVETEFDEELPDCSEIIEVDHSLVGFLQSQMNIAKGEASVISYCLISGGNTTCLIDEQRARKIAKSLGLKVSGTIGILMKMEKKKLISSAYNETLYLKEKGFYISDEIINSLRSWTTQE